MKNSNWDGESCEMLIDLLRKKEYLYNRKHTNYKTYTIIKECTEFGKSLKSPRSSKDVLDKITLFRNEFLKTTAILEADNSQNTQIWPYYEECSFMYFPLFGKPIESLKRKKPYIETSNDETNKLAKKDKREEIIEMPSTSSTKHDDEKHDNEVMDVEEMDVEENEYEQQNDKEIINEFNQKILDLKQKVKKEENKKIKNYNLIGNVDTTKKVIKFLRENPYIFDPKHQKFHNIPYKSKILEKFGKTFFPPISGKQIQRKMRSIRKKFFDSLKTKDFDWPFFEECRFFLGAKFANTDEDIRNLELLDKEYDDNQSGTLTSIFTKQVIEFIRDKPILFDMKHPDYNNHDYKTQIIADFCKNFDPPISVRRMKRKIQTMKDCFFKALRDKKRKWVWFDECKFFLNAATHKAEKNYDQSKNQDNEKIGEETSQTNSRIPTLDIINFIRDKPFLYNTKHPLFQDFKMKNKICENFGKEYQPPVAALQMKQKINHLKRRFFDSLNDKDYWCWYEECKFFLDGKSQNEPLENKILLEDFEGNDIVDEEPEPEPEPESDLSFPKIPTADFLKFLQDNPYLYNKEHPIHQDYRFRMHIFEEYGKRFIPPASGLEVKSRMNQFKRRFIESLNDKEPWAWFDHCQFFLENSKDVSPENKKLHAQFKRKEIKVYPEKENFTDLTIKDVIDFLHDKPYMYDKSHPKFEDKNKKYEECLNFGGTFNPPIPAETIAEKIIYIKNQIAETQQLLKESNNDPIHKWRWYDECNFMHTVFQTNTSTLLPEDLDFQTYKKNKFKESNIMIKIVNFVEDNPFFYDKNDLDYNNSYLKTIVRNKFINKIQPGFSGIQINKLIDSAIKQISSSTIEEEEEDLKVINLENDFNPMDNMFIKEENLKFEESKKIKILVDSSVQCNLFDELWQERLTKSEVLERNCRCIEEFFEINTPIKLLPKKIKSEQSEYSDDNCAMIEDETNFSPIDDDFKAKENENYDLDDCENINLSSRVNQANQKFYTTQIIDYIRDKPFLYDRSHPYFTEYAFKYYILEEFSKGYDPPISVATLKKKVNTLRVCFTKSVRNDKPEKWRWTDSCQFFLNSSNKISPENEELYQKFKNMEPCKPKKIKETKANTLSDSINDTPNLDDWPPYAETSSSSEDETYKFFEKPKNVLKKMQKLPDGTYGCDKCDRKFETLAAVKIHQRFHGDKSLLCMKCGKMNKNLKKLKMHELYCDLDKQKFCYECNQIYKTHLNYNDHLNQYHDNAKPYICVCHHTFKTYDRIIKHMNTYKCGLMEECTVPDYITKEYLATFLEIPHYDDEDYGNKIKKTKFWCRICKINHIVNRQYKKHFKNELHLEAENYWMEKFNIQKIFPCEFCTDGNNIFDNLYDLVHHRHGVHRKCTLNDYFEKLEKASTEILNTIREPIPSEYSECLSACRVCRKEFLFKEFKEHFQDKEHLSVEKSWTAKYSIEKFVCQICDSEFEKLFGFLSHQYDEHDIWPINRNLKQLEGAEMGVINITKKYRYYCSLCDDYFRDRRYYYDHLHMHKNISPYICSCGKSFRHHQNLVTHARKRCVKEGQIVPEYAIIGVIRNENNLEISSSSLITKEEEIYEYEEVY